MRQLGEKAERGVRFTLRPSGHSVGLSLARATLAELRRPRNLPLRARQSAAAG
jgi:hypothetical protein